MCLLGTSNSSLPQASHFLLPPPSLAQSRLCLRVAHRQPSLRPKHSVHRLATNAFSRNHLLPSTSQNSRNWLAFLPFWFNLYFFFFFFQQKEQGIFRPFFLNFGVNFLTISLWFHVKISLLVTTSCTRAVIMVASLFSDDSFVTLLHWVLCIARGIFVASVRSVFQFWTFPKLWSKTKCLLCVIFFSPSFISLKLNHTFLTTIWSEVVDMVLIEPVLALPPSVLKTFPHLSLTWCFPCLYSCSDISHVPYLWT